jgi:hypothetical protein
MLTEILQQALEPVKNLCACGTWISQKSEEDQKLFNKVMVESKLPMSDLFAKLSPLGLPFGITTFKSHIKGTCTCPKV